MESKLKKEKQKALPEGWEMVRLGEVADFKNGINFTPSEGQNLIQVLGVGDFKDFSLLSQCKSIPFLSIDKNIDESYFLKKNDLVFVRFNGNKNLVGRCILINSNEKFLTHSGFTIRARLQKKANFIPEYISLLMQYGVLKKSLKRDGRGTNISNLNQEMLGNVLIPNIPLPQQKKIVSILDTWSEAIEKLEKLIELKKKRFEWVRDKVFFDLNFIKNSENVRRSTLGDLGEAFSGLVSISKDDLGNGSSFIPYTNIFSNYSVDINSLEKVNLESNNKKQNLVEKGDVFFTISSEIPSEVGVSSVLCDDIEESVYLNSFCFGWRSKIKFDLDFLKYYFRSRVFRKQIIKLGQGATRFNISKNQVLKLEIVFPKEISKQREISIRLMLLHRDYENNIRNLNLLKKQKQGLMQKLLSGEILV